MRQVTAAEVPSESQLQAWLPGTDFRDAWQAELTGGRSDPLEVFRSSLQVTPRWVDGLMGLRNRLVAPLGIRSVGLMKRDEDAADRTYGINDRLGIFTVLARTERELLLGIDDTHLDVRVSVLTQPDGERGKYVVSTAVKIHNWLGRLYMIPVGRIHPFVVRAMMRRTPA